MIRSSSTQESLTEKGAYDTRELPADYDQDSIRRSLRLIYEDFAATGAAGVIAVVIQARAKTLSRGHASNEKRVSSTENHWSWEIELLGENARRFNSQRAAPNPTTRLTPASISRRNISATLKEVARWCTGLQQGRVHFEWGLTERHLWIFQLDFENDQPDFGCDPRRLLRDTLFFPLLPICGTSYLRKADLATKTGWRKIDNASLFADGRTAPYPQLFYVLGEDLNALDFDRRQLIMDIDAVTRGRAVCRTDCNAVNVPRLNLPRTESVSAEAAVDFMIKQLHSSPLNKAEPGQVCFIIHRFIPACVAVWALARPHEQLVIVDAIWGLPDGLQYLNHDTYEYDTKRDEQSAEHVRYKPIFLQETPSGRWQLVKVARDVTRGRCLGRSDLREVANQSRAIARKVGRAVQVMWFCEIDERLGVGRNVPWFMMNTEDKPKSAKTGSVSPGAVIINISSVDDLVQISASNARRCVLRLVPKAELFRDDHFIREVASFANAMRVPVLMTGSILSHAFYILEREEVSVLTAHSSRTRTRQRQVFRKLVRDEVPAKIVEQGERVVTARIPKAEARTALVVKLIEEAHELLNAGTPLEVTGELADLVEVVRSLCLATGVDWEDVQRAADLKRTNRGSFEHNVVLMETSWPTLGTSSDSADPPTIALKELGQSTFDGKTTTISFPAVLAKGGDNTVLLAGGAHVEVSMSGTGIHLRTVDRGESLRQLQLNLPL